MGFLPDNYEPPASGNYMRFDQGENRLRFMSPAIVGSVFWVTEPDGNRKPVRRRMGEEIRDDELGFDQHGKKERPKHFWALSVWNYKAGQLQILEITQATIRDAIVVLDIDPDWGNPCDYDIKIGKSGAGLDTTYSVTPSPKTPPPPGAAQAMAGGDPDLEALFSGGDPFASTGGETQAPAAPAQADNPQTTTAAVTGSEIKGGWYIFDTPGGKFGTQDAALGDTIQSFGDTLVALTYHVTPTGQKVITAAAPAAPDEDPPPFT